MLDMLGGREFYFGNRKSECFLQCYVILGRDNPSGICVLQSMSYFVSFWEGKLPCSRQAFRGSSIYSVLDPSHPSPAFDSGFFKLNCQTLTLFCIFQMESTQCWYQQENSVTSTPKLRKHVITQKWPEMSWTGSCASRCSFQKWKYR